MPLKSIEPEKYNGNYSETALEQWKTCVEAATSNTEKRNNTNSIFITINSALVAFISYSLNIKSIVLSVIGVIICLLWKQSINNYKLLSSVKYYIINEIEQNLPLAPFSYEWEKLKTEHNYKGLTKIEAFLPWLFLAVYLISILLPILKLLVPIICSCLGGD